MWQDSFNYSILYLYQCRPLDSYFILWVIHTFIQNTLFEHRDNMYKASPIGSLQTDVGI